MDKVRVGIIGMGNEGRGLSGIIISGQCPELEITAAADIRPDRLSWVTEHIPGAELYGDAIEMLDRAPIDAIIIATPHYYHPTYAIEAFRRGKHVLVEKPAGVYTKQIREMNEAAAASGKVFAMMFNQRTNCCYRKLRELVQSGQYGEIRRSNWIITNWFRSQSYYDSGDWRATWSGEGGGVLLNQSPHQLDMWQWICGMPSRISAHMYFGRWHNIEVEDDVTVYAEYPNGATGVFITTTGDFPGTNRFEVTLDRARIICEGDRLNLVELDIPTSEFIYGTNSIFATQGTHTSVVETDGQNPQHAGVMRAFAGAVLRGEPLVAPGEEGIHGVELSNAMHLSAWLGREIDLPFDEDLFYSELMKRVATSRRKSDGGAVADVGGSFAGVK